MQRYLLRGARAIREVGESDAAHACRRAAWRDLGVLLVRARCSQLGKAMNRLNMLLTFCAGLMLAPAAWADSPQQLLEMYAEQAAAADNAFEGFSAERGRVSTKPSTRKATAPNTRAPRAITKIRGASSLHIKTRFLAVPATFRQRLTPSATRSADSCYRSHL